MTNIFKKYFAFLLFALPLMLLGLGIFSNIHVSAQGLEAFKIVSIGELDGVAPADTLGDLLVLIRNFLKSLAIPFAILVMTWGGFQYFFSGISEKQKSGLKAIEASIIGLVIIFLAEGLVGSNGLLSEIFGVTNGKLAINEKPINALILTIIGIMQTLGTTVAIFVIIWGGYKYFWGGITEKGDGLNSIKKGVIGLAIINIATALVNFIVSTVTVSSTNPNALPDQIVKSLTSLILNVNSVLTGLAVTVTILVIVWGGYQYLFGGFNGKSQGLSNIQKGVTGLVVVILASFIANTVDKLFSGIKGANDFSKLPGQAGNILRPILENATNTLLLMAALVAVLVIIYGGYKYYFSAIPGQKNGLDTIRSGIIGLIVVIIAKPVVTLIQVTLNATDPNNIQPNTLQFNTQGIVFVIKAVIINLLIPVSSVVAVFFLVIGGYYWLTSNGSTEQIKKGKDAIQNAIIGFIIILLSITIVSLIVYLVKPEELNSASNTIPVTTTTPNTTTTTTTTTTTSPNPANPIVIPVPRPALP